MKQTITTIWNWMSQYSGAVVAGYVGAGFMSYYLYLPEPNSYSMIPADVDTAWEYMVYVHRRLHFFSRERPGQQASTSEIKRWLNQKAVLINGETPSADTFISFPITQLVLFPKSEKSRITLY